MLEKHAERFWIISSRIAWAHCFLSKHRIASKHAVLTRNDEPVKFILDAFPGVRDMCIAAGMPTAAAKIDRIIEQLPGNPAPSSAKALIGQIKALSGDIRGVVAERFLLYVPPHLSNFHGRIDAFGELVTKKFRSARDDIEHAGNCIAVGEATASVFHLMRAMEVAVRVLAKKLGVHPSPKDTWGMILSNMDDGIKALPVKTSQQRKKKVQWSEARVNLYHVKQAHRDEYAREKKLF